MTCGRYDIRFAHPLSVSILGSEVEGKENIMNSKDVMVHLRGDADYEAVCANPLSLFSR